MTYEALPRRERRVRCPGTEGASLLRFGAGPLPRGIRSGLAAHTVTTLFYLLHRKIGLARTKAALMDLVRVLRIVPVDQDRILQAFAMEWDDLEDAVQAACAGKAEADYLLKRDRRGFAAAQVMALSPAEFLAYTEAGPDRRAPTPSPIRMPI